MSVLDLACEEHFLATHSRTSSGRYVVRLPFKKPIEELGRSSSYAYSSLCRLQQKFKNDADLCDAYSTFLGEYEHLRHMIRIPDTRDDPPTVFYLPHHGVFQGGGPTSKLRVVFNGSCPVTGGVSLNEILHCGPKLQTDLSEVLLWMRRTRYVFSCDIEKMYRQVLLHQDDRDYQRIMWSDQNVLRKYHLTTVTYGLACAPYLALRTIIQLIKDEGAHYPLAVEIMNKGRYVNDIFGGGDSIEEVQEQIGQLRALCLAGGFPLRKWIANCPDLLVSVPSAHRGGPMRHAINDDFVPAFGLQWDPSSDTFRVPPFVLDCPVDIWSKPQVLSIIAKFFHPLGFLSPLYIPAKVFMQELWSLQMRWDDPLPSHQHLKWTSILSQLNGMEAIVIPRWIGMSSHSQAEIHGFCDASLKAMSAVVYLKVLQDGSMYFLCSKTKVAPLKRLTVPRLELSAALMLSELTHLCVRTLDLVAAPCFLWTDSSIVYTWVTNDPSRRKEFVYNRIQAILHTLPSAQWRHVAGVTNPADCATRELSVSELKSHTLWWKGPPWLLHNSDQWPHTAPERDLSQKVLEARPKVVNVAVCAPPCWDLMHRYSSLTRLLRVTATVRRAIQRFRGSDSPQQGSLSPDKLNNARLFWVHSIQRAHFAKEIAMLLSNSELPKSCSLRPLTPFVDGRGLLRVGGRLQHSNLSSPAIHPYILPKDSYLSNLIIDDAHNHTLHGSTQLTLSHIRCTYWILGGRIPVRSFILKCITCLRHRRIKTQQIMGQLPASRVNPSQAFLHSGLDYAGPIQLKTWRGRNARTYKAWIALIVCFSTSAVHLEVVTDYSSHAFLAAYRRFTARRGICSTLSSDCGTNFKGADRELQNLFSQTSSELLEFASIIANDGTSWKFNPPAAPHFGGKWEAGVKSMKYRFKQIVGESCLTYEEVSTVLTQIEAIMNSRPLCPLTDDPDDLDVLTPGHFLIGQPLTLIPEPALDSVPINRLSRWQHLSQITQTFWSTWSRSCLQRYQAVYKWNRTGEPIAQGTLVLLMDDQHPPGKWPLGRVEKIFPGKDNVVRVVEIRTKAGSFLRPIVKVIPLPIQDNPDTQFVNTVDEGGRNVKS